MTYLEAVLASAAVNPAFRASWEVDSVVRVTLIAQARFGQAITNPMIVLPSASLGSGQATRLQIGRYLVAGYELSDRSI
jgi:hypothetical protein